MKEFASHRRNRLSRLPPWLSHWLGYRSPTTPSNPPGQLWEICLWSFIGAFCGTALIQAVFGHANYFIRRSVPPIIASYGASAVIIYGVVETPVAQPRALLGGHFLGALTGVCITKLFHLLPTEKRFQELLWLCSSLACASSVVVMELTGTTHPPAGATALLAAVNPAVREIGWYFLPVILLSSALALSVALIINNIRRRYPAFWFKPGSDSDSDSDMFTSRTITTGSSTVSFGDTVADTRVNSVENLSEKKGGDMVSVGVTQV